MSHTNWNIEDIETARTQLNQLQQQMKQYEGVKKLGRAFSQSLVASIKGRLAQFMAKRLGTAAAPSPDFYAKNPDFEPYRIRLKQPLAGVDVPKILHVIPSFATGGSPQLIVDLVEGLSDAYTHELVLMSTHLAPGYVGIPVHDSMGIREPEEFTALLHRVRPDIVHVHYYGQWPNYFWQWYHIVFQGAFAYGRPVIENCNIPHMPYYHAGIARYVYVSEYARDTFGVRHLPNQVIYPGSNFSFFRRGNTLPDPDTIGMVYRLDHDKLNERAIEPFIRAVQKRPQTKVLIVGGGQQLEAYQQRVAAAGLQNRFTFTGYVAYEKLAALYQQLAVFVAPVYSESFGQVTPFAMNMGIPVAAYNVGALSEMLDNPTVLALGDDVEVLSDIVVGLLDDPARREQIGAENRARARELFTVEIMVEAYRELYRFMH